MRIKAKSGYTVNITDINISLQNNRDFIEVDDDTFNNSIDAKKLMKYIEIDNGTANVASIQPNKEKIASATVHAAEVIPNTFVITEAITEKQTNSIVFDPNNEANLNVVKTINTVTHKAKQQDTNDTSQNVAADIKVELEPQKTNNDTKSTQANTSSNTTDTKTNNVSNTAELNTTVVNTSKVDSSKTNEAENNTKSNTNIISEPVDNKSATAIDTKSEKKKSKKK